MSLLALVPDGSLSDEMTDCPGSPVLVHVSVCKQHTRAVRRWLRAAMRPDDDVMTLGTEVLMREWKQIVDPVQVPVMSASRAV